MNHDQLLQIRDDYVGHVRRVAEGKEEEEEKEDKENALPWAKNIVGTGIGLKIKENEIQPDSHCVVLFVRKKIAARYLGHYSLDKFLESKNKGLADHEKVSAANFDVVEVGSFKTTAGPRSWSRHPLGAIVNIGADLTTAFDADHETLCAFVQKNDNTEEVYFLSALHGVDGHQGLYKEVVSGGDVIGDIAPWGESNLLPGDCICEPCPTDPAYNQLDAVVCQLRTPDFIPRFDLPGGGYLAPLPGNPANYLHREVRKAGGTVSTGTIQCTDVCATVDFPSETACLPGQFVICSKLGDGLPFSLPGDSGSLIVTCGDGDEHTALGMLVAAGDPVSLLRGDGELPLNFSIATPIQTILDYFKLKLLVDHNPQTNEYFAVRR